MLTKRTDTSRMNDLSSEMQNCLTGVLVRSRMRWEGHVEWMTAVKLAKLGDIQNHQGHRRRGRPQQRWEGCVGRDGNRPGDDIRWSEAAADRSNGARRLWRET